MTTAVLPLRASEYQPHFLHGPERIWQETNCAADLWIEGLHALGLDPVAALAFTLGTDFDGDQWRMFKYPGEDVRALYGIETDELNVWRPLVDHVAEQISLGRLVTIDVDAWHLPDTAGLTYGCAHQKTTIMAQMIDLDTRQLGYFHNTAYFELAGGDFDGLLRVGDDSEGLLPPYVESVRLDHLRKSESAPVSTVVDQVQAHLSRRPTTNPLSRMRKRIEEDLPWLVAEGLDAFHRYAFGSLRQCGANAELASSLVHWLGQHGDEDLAPAAGRLIRVAEGMKSAEFVLARAVRGRSVDLATTFAPLEDAWEEALSSLAARFAT
jgi:hypothetical protein